MNQSSSQFVTTTTFEEVKTVKTFKGAKGKKVTIHDSGEVAMKVVKSGKPRTEESKGSNRAPDRPKANIRAIS